MLNKNIWRRIGGDTGGEFDNTEFLGMCEAVNINAKLSEVKSTQVDNLLTQLDNLLIC